jgi:hypothetical protein
LLVQKKVTKEKDTRAGAGMCRTGLFALTDFDSPSWLSKIGRDVAQASLSTSGLTSSMSRSWIYFFKKTCPPRTSTWG